MVSPLSPHAKAFHPQGLEGALSAARRPGVSCPSPKDKRGRTDDPRVTVFLVLMSGPGRPKVYSRWQEDGHSLQLPGGVCRRGLTAWETAARWLKNTAGALPPGGEEAYERLESSSGEETVVVYTRFLPREDARALPARLCWIDLWGRPWRYHPQAVQATAMAAAAIRPGAPLYQKSGSAKV